MARMTTVKSAQQRYATVPVLDAEGNAIKIPLTNKDGSPKLTSGKGGKTRRPVTITKTERDLTRPLPNLRCDFSGCQIDGGEILPGTSYKWIKPKSGPYGGRQLNRHAQHPSWNVWDYSSSLSARVAQIEHDATSGDDPISVEEAEEILSNAADEIRALAEEKRESASNIEDGFGHATCQSEELEQTADDLDGWADEVEGTEIPSMDEYRQGEKECPECGGDGTVENEDYDETDDDSEEEKDCDECQGTGQVDTDDSDDLDDEAMGEWQAAVMDAMTEALGNCPV